MTGRFRGLRVEPAMTNTISSGKMGKEIILLKNNFKTKKLNQ